MRPVSLQSALGSMNDVTLNTATDDSSITDEAAARALYADLPPEEAAQRIAGLRRLARWLTAAAFVLPGAYLFLPDPDHLLLAMMLAAPWAAVGLVWRFRPLYQFDGRRSDPRPTLVHLLVLPGFALAIGVGLAGVSPVHWQALLPLTCGGALALTGAAVSVDPRLTRQPVSIIAMVLLTAPYGGGAGMQLNVRLDSSVAQVYPVKVISKEVHHSAKSGDSWYLRLAPWGPVTQPRSFRVPYVRYRATHTGEVVCVLLHAGALGIPWYRLAPRGACNVRVTIR